MKMKKVAGSEHELLHRINAQMKAFRKELQSSDRRCPLLEDKQAEEPLSAPIVAYDDSVQGGRDRTLSPEIDKHVYGLVRSVWSCRLCEPCGDFCPECCVGDGDSGWFG
ncbi:microtubule cross-linking factor 1-like isoform X1 [Lates japonicus]|uniref:Microtubule cross-linking factor 1-like isoform X1 n=1 Tax=Lates japonicus TaxID=270547 RepID=A0AAD3QWK2_LATJO|nr:microtubule cross-linking factor 1-like isoform X1 [Lates japonicus]